MKKILTTLAVLATASVLMADLSDLTLSFSTSGPDSYADGSPVAVGETYLLVYVSENSSGFAGIQMDGSLVDPVNNRVATTSTAIRGAKCGFKAIQYPASLFPAGGSWVIVLLDTRDASGAPGGLVAAHGTVNVGTSVSAGSTSLASGSTSVGVNAAARAAIPAGTPAPAIADLAVSAGKASIQIANFANGALYEVQTSTDLASGWQPASGPKAARIQAAGGVLTGKSGAPVLPAEVDVGDGDTVRFFRVIVPGT